MATSWEELERRYSSGAAPQSADGWSALEKRFAQPSMQSAMPQETFDPTAGMSRTQLFLAGTGKAFTDIARGVGQLVGKVSDEEIAQSRREDAALMRRGWGQAGNVVGNVAAAVPTAFIPGANTVVGAGAIGAGFGAVQPALSGQERITNIALGGAGGAAGQGIANKIGSIARTSASPLTQGQQQAAAAGQRLGMRLTPGQASGSRSLQRVEAALESNPMTSGGFDAIREGNQRILARAAAKSIGEQADELSSPVIDRALTRMEGVFNSVADKTPVPLDPIQVGGKVRQILADFDGMLMNNNDLAANGLMRRLDDFVNNRGGASREQLRALSSNMGKAARQNMTSPQGDRALGEALFNAQQIVEDAIQGSLQPAQQAAYGQARDQYRNMMLLTAKTNVVNPSSGTVSGRNLATNLMRNDRSGFTRGQNTSDMYDAARFVQAFPSIVGDSGTATRSLGAADYFVSAPGNLLARMYLSRPVTAAASGAGRAAGTAARLTDNELMRLMARPAGAALGLQGSYALQQ